MSKEELECKKKFYKDATIDDLCEIAISFFIIALGCILPVIWIKIFTIICGILTLCLSLKERSRNLICFS